MNIIKYLIISFFILYLKSGFAQNIYNDFVTLSFHAPAISSVSISRFEMPEEKAERELKKSTEKLSSLEEELTQTKSTIAKKIKYLKDLKSKSAKQIAIEKKQAEDLAKAKAKEIKDAKIVKLKKTI